MDIVVTVKQVPDPDIPPTHFKVDQAANKVIPPAGQAPVMNGYDAHALEAALVLRDQVGGKVTVVTMARTRRATRSNERSPWAPTPPCT